MRCPPRAPPPRAPRASPRRAQWRRPHPPDNTSLRLATLRVARPPRTRTRAYPVDATGVGGDEERHILLRPCEDKAGRRRHPFIYVNGGCRYVQKLNVTACRGSTWRRNGRHTPATRPPEPASPWTAAAPQPPSSRRAAAGAVRTTMTCARYWSGGQPSCAF
eukprot:6182506-Pleurochrysis_carterae.AAC.4